MSVLQTPRPVREGATEWTVAAAYVTDTERERLFEGADEFLGPLPSVAVRFGQDADLDWGVRAGFPEGVSFDIRKRLIDGPASLSGYLGLATLFAHAGLIAGNDRAYAGVRGFFGQFEEGDREGGWGAFAGGVFGRAPSWVPEIGVISFGSGESLVVLSLGAKWPQR